jgi:hypothetical protein
VLVCAFLVTMFLISAHHRLFVNTPKRWICRVAVALAFGGAAVTTLLVGIGMAVGAIGPTTAIEGRSALGILISCSAILAAIGIVVAHIAGCESQQR